MNAIGMKLTLFVSPLITSLLIVPSGWSRSQSDAPWRMLRVPSVAMIEGRRRTRIRVALKMPVASPTAEERERSREVAPARLVGVIVYDASTTQNVISAATDTSKPPTRSAVVCPIATSASGIVVRSRLLRLYEVRNASSRPPCRRRARRSASTSGASGSQPWSLRETLMPASPRPPSRGAPCRAPSRRSPRRYGARRGRRPGSRRRSCRATSRRRGRTARRARAGRST